MIMCAVFAALSAVLSQLSIPIGLVPVNFIHASIFAAVGLLGVKYGTLSQVVFVLLGAVGVPVFSQFRGGFGVITGPTGGFIISYILCALVTGWIIHKFGKRIVVLISAIYAGWFVTYLIGIPWFMYIQHVGLQEALVMCLYPFLLGDAVKSFVAILLIRALHKRLSV